MFSAVSAGAVSSGWIPDWFQSDALDVREVHDIDTIESALALGIPSGIAWQPPSHCRPIVFSAIILPRL